MEVHRELWASRLKLCTGVDASAQYVGNPKDLLRLLIGAAESTAYEPSPINNGMRASSRSFASCKRCCARAPHLSTVEL